MVVAARAGARRRFTRGLAGLLAFLSLASAPSCATAEAPLSWNDAQLLQGGHILFKTETPDRGATGAALGGTARAVVHADADTVWRTLMDFPAHAGLFPTVKASEVIEHGAERTLVRYLVAVGPFAFRFFVNNYADPASRVLRWELDRSRKNDLFRHHWGYWKVEPWHEGVLVTYAMGSRTKLPAFLTRAAGEEGTVLAVKALKERVERDAGGGKG